MDPPISPLWVFPGLSASRPLRTWLYRSSIRRFFKSVWVSAIDRDSPASRVAASVKPRIVDASVEPDLGIGSYRGESACRGLHKKWNLDTVDNPVIFEVGLISQRPKSCWLVCHSPAKQAGLGIQPELLFDCRSFYVSPNDVHITSVDSCSFDGFRAGVAFTQLQIAPKIGGEGHVITVQSSDGATAGGRNDFRPRAIENPGGHRILTPRCGFRPLVGRLPERFGRPGSTR